MRIEMIGPGPGSPYGDTQRRMREKFAPHGIVVVRETKPEESPRFDPDGIEIVY